MKISSHLFHIVEQPVRDLLCWLWFLILCKLPLFTFPPSSLNLNLYVLNSRSHDCGSIRPIQPKTMDAASPMVWWAAKYQVGWLSTHCSYSNPSSRKPLSTSNIRIFGRKGAKVFSWGWKPICSATSAPVIQVKRVRWPTYLACFGTIHLLTDWPSVI